MTDLEIINSNVKSIGVASMVAGLLNKYLDKNLVKVQGAHLTSLVIAEETAKPIAKLSKYEIDTVNTFLSTVAKGGSFAYFLVQQGDTWKILIRLLQPLNPGNNKGDGGLDSKIVKQNALAKAVAR